MNNDEMRIALFIDFENIAIGVRDAHYKKFDINLVLERLLEKGKILVKKAYADWTRYSDHRRKFHENSIELIEVPQKSIGGKNSADIRLVVDAMDLSSQKEHISCFVILSGDSDFSPLVSKLKENGKHVIGLGVKNSTSELLIDNCDEFIFYEDLVQSKARAKPAKKPAPAKPAPEKPAAAPQPAKEAAGAAPASRRRGRPATVAAEPVAKAEPGPEDLKGRAIDIVVGTLEQLVAERGGEGAISASLIKNTIKRMHPGFSEAQYGYSAFGKILDDANRKGVLVVDKKEGGAVLVSLPLSRAE